jgi:hypothetical protein
MRTQHLKNEDIKRSKKSKTQDKKKPTRVSEEIQQWGKTSLHEPGAPDSVRCPGWRAQRTDRSREKLAPTAKIHRTVRCAPDCPVSLGPTVIFTNGRLLCSQKGQKSRSDQRKSVAPDCPVCHQTIWCTTGQTNPTVNSNGRLTWQAPDTEQCRVWCAPDYSVRPSTES